MPTKYPKNSKHEPYAYSLIISKITPRQASTPHAETSENASASALKLCENGTNKPKLMLATLPAPPLIWLQKIGACAKKTPS